MAKQIRVGDKAWIRSDLLTGIEVRGYDVIFYCDEPRREVLVKNAGGSFADTELYAENMAAQFDAANA